MAPDGVISLKQAPDYETKPTISFAVEVRYVREGQDATAGWQGRKDFTIDVTDVNEAPTSLALETLTSSLDENTPVDERVALARLVVTDPDKVPAFRRHEFSLPDKDTSPFVVDDGVLYLKAGAVLDHEAAASHTVTLTLDGTGLTQSFTLAVEDVNEAPTVTIDRSQTLTLYEGSSKAADTGYTVSATDPDAGDAVTFSVRDDKRFGIVDGKLRVKDGQSFDFETEPSIDLIIIGTDRGGLEDEQTVTINVTNTNDIPPTWDELADVSVAEGVPDTGLTVTTAKKKGAGGEDVTYEIVDAAMRKIFKITDDGILQFRHKPDHDDGGPTSYAVKIRASSAPVREGGITQTAEQTVRVEVINLLDEALRINAITNLEVDENNTALTGTTRLGVTSDEQGDYQVEYRLAGGAAHDFVEVTPDGVIRLKQAPDH